MDTMDEKMTLVAAGPSYTAWSEFSDTRREFGDAGVPGARRFRPAQRRLRGEAMTRLKKAAMDGCTVGLAERGGQGYGRNKDGSCFSSIILGLALRGEIAWLDLKNLRNY